ncbi:MAG: heat-inducible transcriptional repressor HrcA, partial [Stenotrophomonas bentonitica]
AEIRARLLLELRDAQSEMEQLLAHSIELAEQAMVPPADDMVLAGQTRLMGVQDLSDLERLRELFDVFASKREILQLLERTIQAPGVRIFIGEETGVMPLESVSLVTAPYSADGQVLGVLGVIGPKRMAYDRMIPLVEATAQVLGAALGSPGGGGLSRDRA